MTVVINPDIPNGFQPSGLLSGLSHAGNMRTFSADGGGSDLFRGDFCILEADGRVTVDTAAGSAAHLGIFVGMSGVELRSVGNTENLGYYDASEGSSDNLLVCLGLNLLVEAQEDGVSAGMAVTAIGANTTIVATAGSTVTGLSQQEIDSSEVSTTNTDHVTIMRLVNSPTNQLGTDDATIPWARWICLCNNVFGSGPYNVV